MNIYNISYIYTYTLLYIYMHTDGLADSFQTLWEKSVDFYRKFRFLRSLWYVPLKVDHHYPHETLQVLKHPWVIQRFRLASLTT